MEAAARRSGRQRKANAKYANDGWDKETLRILSASSESSGSSPDENLQARVAFQAGKSNAALSDGGKEFPLGLTDDVSVVPEGSESSDVATSSEGEGDMSLATSDEDDLAHKKPQNQVHWSDSSGIFSTPHSRGLTTGRKHASKSAAYQDTFGPDVEDLSNVLDARDIWLKGCDVTLPSRRSIADAIEKSQGLPSTPAATVDKAPGASRSRSINEARVDDLIRQNQSLRGIDDKELQEKYMPRKPSSHSVVLGPWDKQTKFDLPPRCPLNLGQAWATHAPKDLPVGGRLQKQLPTRPPQEGWLINVGEKVQCLSWALATAEIQYLAIVTRSTPGQRLSVPGHVRDRPAFHPSPAYPSHIQIWAFQTQAIRNSHVRRLSFTVPPRLVMVVGTDFGDIRRIKWCPQAPSDRDVHVDGGPAAVDHLLGIVSTDGCARILSLSLLQHISQDSHIALKVAQAGLTVKPPLGTVFTTLTFADPTTLVLGASDGSVQLFDLATVHDNGSAASGYLRQQIHNTYITSLCSAWPGSLSTFIASSSAAGELVLTDWRSPQQDRVSVARACFPQCDIVFSPHTRSFLTGLDRAGNTQVEAHLAPFIICHHLREFHTGHKIARLPELSGAATALANSPCHPCILIGTSNGQVLSTNYLRKALAHRRSDSRNATGAYMQKLYDYEWRPLAAGESDDVQSPTNREDAEPDLYHGAAMRPGVSRFHEGFKPEKIEVGTVPLAKKKPQHRETRIAEPIFEEEQSVTSIDCCPNLACAGIAAIGWGSGIVRVQDLAHDLE
ncbi:hypothetical protein ABEF95_007176 [Exophiala dermatitidis]